MLGGNQVKVGDQVYEADYIVLASGGSARKFAGFIDNDERFLISDNIFELKKFPKSLAIVGGGPSTEFATFFNTFGVKVTLIDMAENILQSYDLELGKELGKCFVKDGISLNLGVKINSIDSSGEMLNMI